LHLIYEQKWTVKDIDYFVEQAPRFPFVNTLVIDPSDLETVSRADSLATIIQAFPALREFRIEGYTNPDIVDALLKGLVGAYASCKRLKALYLHGACGPDVIVDVCSKFRDSLEVFHLGNQSLKFLATGTWRDAGQRRGCTSVVFRASPVWKS